MNKQFLVGYFSIVAVFFLAPTHPLHAQVAPSPTSTPTPTTTPQQLPPPEPKITSDDLIRVDKKAIFDASDSVVTSSAPAEYIWDFGVGGKIFGKEAVQEFSTLGKKTITLTIRQGGSSVSVQKDVFIFDNKVLLIIDEKQQEQIDDLNRQAAENGVALKLLSITEKEGAILTEDALVQKIKENGDYIKDSNVLIFYTQSPLGLQAFNLYWKDLDEKTKEIIKSKFFVVISDSDLDTSANLAYQTFNIVGQNYILLTRKEAINPLFITKDTTQVIDVLKNRSIEYRIVDQRGEKSPAFVLSHFVSGLVAQGVSSNILYIILIVPFLAFIATFSKQVVGISTFGIYTPVIIAISFFILGLWLGTVTFLFAVITGYLVKYVLNKFEFLYLPKVALNLTFISLSFLIVIWLALQYGTSVPLSIAIFPMLVMSTVSEKFMAAQSEEGIRGALFGVIGTLFIVVVSYYCITWRYFNSLILSWPELVILPILATLILGKFTGLRLAEYVRFRSLLTEHQE